MKYFIAENGQQVGPLELDELTAHGLTVNSLVWHEGLPQWERAANIPELHTLLGINPQPPTPPPFGETILPEPQPISPKTELGTYYTPQQPVIMPRPTNSAGTAGFILTLFAYFLCWMPGVNSTLGLAGLLLSFIGLFKEPRGLAIAGFVMSLIGLGGTLVFINSFFGNMLGGVNFLFPFLE